MNLYLLKKVLSQIKGKRKKVFTLATAIAISHTRSEMENLKIQCELFECKNGVSKYSVHKHPAGFIGFTYCFNHGEIYYEVVDVDFEDDIELLVFEAQVKSSILINSDNRRKYINWQKGTNF